ncbi:DUF2460 domain-containing protein [Falsiruegeria litorea]|uniref:DUF2460 domain-containing protein n=1 Tax=Falsiruegeria litorea TaxID=1280831 RepID=UPI001BFE1D50|nr:DUF2460 domain-containing protein [Falsiruegeria litorea]MBT8169872.1 DUF2460 domain-containing protein [Falsiruegeria litorea]
MAHLDIDFPRNIATGCQAILERRDEVVTLASGHEETNQRWTHARRSWNAGLALRSAADLSRVVEIFEEVRGRANSFRFRDWLDWRSGLAGQPITPTDQPLGTGDGSNQDFQIVKRYGVVNPYMRPIALPHLAGLRIAINGVEVTTGWSLASVGGLVTFDTAPPPGSTLTAGFTFDVPVRFAQNSLSVEWAYFNDDGDRDIGLAPDITLIEKRLDGSV